MYNRPGGICHYIIKPHTPATCTHTYLQDLEAAVIETIEAGKFTKDLAICVHQTTKVTPEQVSRSLNRRQHPIWTKAVMQMLQACSS